MSDSVRRQDSKRKKVEDGGKLKKEESKRKDELKKKEDPKKEDSKRELKKKEESKKTSSPEKKRPSAAATEEKKEEKHHHHDHSRHISKKVTAAAAVRDDDDDVVEEVSKKKKKKAEDSDSEGENEGAVINEPTLDLDVMPSDPLLQESEETPLAKLVMEGEPEALQKALESEKDEVIDEALGDNSVSLLHLAAARGNPKITELLLKKHASCNSRDKFDNTPLHYAAYFNHFNTLIALLDEVAATAVHETKPQKGKSPRAAAKEAGDAKYDKNVNPEVARALNKRNEQGITPLYFAAANGNAQMCDEMLKRGANPNMTGPQNRSPLHEAVLSRNVDCVSSLLQGGADLALRDMDQRTAIHYSVLLPVECRQIVMVLTNPKQHFDDLDRYEKSALHYAVLQNYDDSIGLFTLVSEGSNVCIVYDLRLLMEKNCAPKIDAIPLPLRMPRHQKYSLRREDSQKVLTGKRSELYVPSAIVKKDKPTGKRVYKSEAGDKPRQAANRFGFEIINNMTQVHELTPKEVEKERELANKWHEHIKSPEAWERFKKNPKQVKALCALGLPEAVRGQVWSLLGGVPDLIKKQPDTYKILTKNTARREIAHQLDLDVKRSHLEHERFAHPYTDGQLSLFNVMRAYSLHDQTVEYTQGMSDVGGLLLMYLTEEETFWLFSQLMFDDRWALRGVFASGFPLLQQHCYVQTQLLGKYHPQILRHMKKVEFDPCQLQPHAMEWFMTLYIRVLPYAFTVRIFDVILSRGYYVAFRVAMGLFELMKKDILAQKEFPDLMQLLKNPIESCPYIGKLTPDEFMKVVMRYKVTQKMVDKYVAQYKKIQSKK